MKHWKLFYLVLALECLISIPVYAQEKEPEIDIEKSAEVFLEAYSDEFQENFFEALKQKGIENYDRAINYFLECKRLDANNVVIDHELAKTYLADKKYNLAQDYAVAALISEPENLWYLNTLIEALDKQGNTFENLEMSILADNAKLQENLAVVYFRNSKYDEALVVLENLKKTPFLDDLASKINDSLEKRAERSKKMSFSVSNTNRSEGVTTLNGYKGRIQSLFRSKNHMILKQVWKLITALTIP
jgi:tetratricopeptide (TPR) repeat protein